MNGRNPSGVSVIMCCYNSAPRLPETLKHLARQVVSASIAWEVIAVNNASMDATSEVAVKLWREHGAPAPLVVVDEPEAGLSRARQRGIASARYDTLVFVDDDNWLAEDYLGLVSELMRQHPEVGVLAGEIEAHCEATPPEWFGSLQSLFAVGPQGKASGDITSYKLHVAGAGMAVRKSVYEELKRRDFCFLLGDRTAAKLTSGGDTELCMAVRLLGYRIWYDARLRLVHFMPKGRLSREYMLRLVRGIEASFPVIACYEAVIHRSGGSAWRIYFRSLGKRCGWTLKSVVKLVLGRSDLTACAVEFVALGQCFASLPELRRVFKRHYPELVKLREGGIRK